MGLGHAQRNLAIASALTSLAPETQVLLATGADEIPSLVLALNVDTLKLPGLRKLANGQYVPRRLGIDASEIRTLRSALLVSAVNSFQPDVVVVDKHPFGAGGEFRAALEAARRLGGRAVLGFRDILDEPATVLREWSAEQLPEAISDYYDLVLVYGARSVFNPVQQYKLPQAVARRTRYCGYVVNSPVPTRERQVLCDWLPRSRQPVVVATAGGGEDGVAILRTFIKAAADAPWKGVAVSGPLMAQKTHLELRRLAARHDVTLHRFIPRLADSLSVVRGLVCMGGYNTLGEALSCGVPTVCVPRVTPRTEQLLRAQAFERLGLLRHIHPGELTAERLRAEVSLALESSREELLHLANAVFEFAGAQRAAEYLLELQPPLRHVSKVAPPEQSVGRPAPVFQ